MSNPDPPSTIGQRGPSHRSTTRSRCRCSGRSEPVGGDMRRVLMSIAALLLVARPAPAGDVAARVNGTPIDSAMVNEVVKGVIAGRGQAPPPDSEEIARLTDQAL